MCAVCNPVGSSEQHPTFSSLWLLCKQFRVLDDSSDASQSTRAAAWLQFASNEKGAPLLQRPHVCAPSSSDSSEDDRATPLLMNGDDPVAKYATSCRLLRQFAAAGPPRSVEAYFTRVLTYGGQAVRGCVDIATLLLLRLRAKLMVECFLAKQHSVVHLANGADDLSTNDEHSSLADVDSWCVIPNDVLCRLALAALLVAGKVHQDVFPSTKHLAGVWGLRKCSDLVRYESTLLEMLNFDVHITPEEYQAFHRLIANSGNAALVRACGSLVIPYSEPNLASCTNSSSGNESNFFVRFVVKRFAMDSSIDELDDDPFISGAASSVHTPRFSL